MEIVTYATARSISRAKEKTNSLNLKEPVITYNGVFLTDPIKNEVLISNYFNDNEKQYIKDILDDNNILPNVYSFVEGINDIELF